VLRNPIPALASASKIFRLATLFCDYNQRIEVYASYIGATHMDVFIERSERLLKEGKTQILLEAYQDYREQHGGRIPKSSAAAYRAFLLDTHVKQREMEKDTKP